MSNPANFIIHPDAIGVATCFSNAEHYQCVHVSYTQGVVKGAFVFAGQGENEPMKTADGTVNVPIPFPNTEDGRGAIMEVEVTFRYSQNRPADPYDVSSYKGVSKSVNMKTIEHNRLHIFAIESEDASDNDDNDSCVVFTYNAPVMP